MDGLALALGGGGSKGAFQIGAWQAFRELGLTFDAIAGTSIGSINAALMVCDDYDAAAQMWENLKMEQCLELSENQQVRSTDLLSIKNAEILFRELIKQRSLNTDPLRALLSLYIDEACLRRSKVDYGLMTAQMPSLKAQPFWIAEIAEGQLVDYIMASAGLPGLKKVTIEGQRFIDGGFAENVPISMLRDRGFRRIVAIDLSEHAVIRSPLLDNIELTYIHDRQDLGATLDTTPEIISRNRRLGYLDALKAFGRLLGDFYAFAPEDYRELMHRFGAVNVRGLEQAAIAYDIDRLPIYSAGSFVSLIREKRREFELDYARRRQAMQVDHKIRAIMGGRLKVLDMMPPMRLAFLMEMTAKARQGGRLQKIPMHLFSSIDLAAQALQTLDSQNELESGHAQT